MGSRASRLPTRWLCKPFSRSPDLTSTHTQIVVSRDYCEAARHCLITGDPFFRLGVLRNHSCSKPRAAFVLERNVHFGRSDALPFFSAIWASECIIIVCVPLLWNSIRLSTQAFTVL